MMSSVLSLVSDISAFGCVAKVGFDFLCRFLSNLSCGANLVVAIGAGSSRRTTPPMGVI